MGIAELYPPMTRSSSAVPSNRSKPAHAVGNGWDTPLRWSVAIATWNRADLLARTLEALTALRLPATVAAGSAVGGDKESGAAGESPPSGASGVSGVSGGRGWEVLVCDNNSPDHTRRVVESFTKRLPIRYLFEPKQGKAHALTQLVREARGEWMLFLDDDVKVDAGLLEAYERGIATYPEADLFGGPIRPWLERPLRGTRRFLLENYLGAHALLAVDRDTAMVEGRKTPYGPNMAFRRTVMLEDGAINAEAGMFGGRRIAGEDVAMVNTQLSRGRCGWLLADAAVGHYIPRKRTGLRWFCHWQAGWGRSWVATRGAPAAGRFGVPWWAWCEFARRALAAAVAWRPWPTRRFYDRLAAACHYYGYLSEARRGRA